MKAVSRRFLGVVVVGSIGCLMVTAQAQRTEGRRVRTVKGEGLYAALQERVPPVVLHQFVFGRPVQLAQLQPLGLDDTGAPTTRPVVLKYASPGVVIAKTSNATRVDVGTEVAVGDLIVGGVVENAGTTAVLVLFSGGGGVELDRGERLYVGTKARIAESPGAEGGVAASDGSERIAHVDSQGRIVGGEPIENSPSHCFQCSCTCQGSGCSCSATFAADVNSDFSNVNEVQCTCTGGCSGTLKSCTKIAVPCAS